MKQYTFDNPWDDSNRDNGKRRKRGDAEVSKDIEEMLKKGQEKLFSIFSGKKPSGQEYLPVPTSLIALAIVLVVFFMWLATGFYTVDADEEGVVMRFGKYNRTAMPGLNYKLPAPIETVDKVSVTRVNREIIGFKTVNSKLRVSSDESDIGVPKESQMLTGDENIIDMHFFVQWQIKDAKDYLFNLRDDLGESTIKVSSESAMRQVIGRVKIAEALSEQRQEIEQHAKKLLQEILDNYKSGIEVINLGILYSYVAPEVRDAYRDIQSAKADKEREINEAYAYRNDIIPRARGEAQAVIAEATAYKESTVAKAHGEASRFKSVLEQYQKAKDITRKRIYIDTMSQVLQDIDKVIVDKSIANKALPLMSLNELAKGKSKVE